MSSANPGQARYEGLGVTCKEWGQPGRPRILSKGLPVCPGRHGGYRPLDLVEAEPSGPVAEGFCCVSLRERLGRLAGIVGALLDLGGMEAYGGG